MSTKKNKTKSGGKGGGQKSDAGNKPDAKSAPLIAKPPQSVGLVETAKLMPNPWNGNRKADEGLLQSVRAKGVLQNLVARQVKGGKLEVICGGRRLDAAQRTQTKLVPVAIYELTDKEAREIHIIENLQREGKTPIEEAKEVGELLALGKDAKEIAAQLGRPWTWVVRRAALGDLAPEVLKAIESPKHPIHSGSWAMLELLAKYPHEVQCALLKDRKQEWQWRDGDVSSALANLTKELKLAPWATDDVLMNPKAGACAKCSKRSSYSPGLFDDDDDVAQLAAHDRCLDGACWAVKLATHLKRTEEKARAENPGLVKVVTEDIGWGDPLREDKTVLGVHAFEKVKPGSKGAKPALVVQGPGAGTIIHITTRRASNATAGDSGSREKAEPKTLAEKRAGLESRRIALIIVEKLSPALAESKLPIPGGDPLNATKDSFYLRLAAAFGAELIAGGELEDELLGGWRHFDDTEKTDANELHEQIWALAKHGLEKSVEFYKPTDLGEDVMLAAKRLAWLLGLKWIELLQFAVEQIKEPKSWATDHPDKCACAQCEVQRTATKPEKI